MVGTRINVQIDLGMVSLYTSEFEGFINSWEHLFYDLV